MIRNKNWIVSRIAVAFTALVLSHAALPAQAVGNRPKVDPVPKGSHTITPYLLLSDAAKAIDFYKSAFGAEELGRYLSTDGQRIAHAELKIGDSTLMLSDDFANSAMGKRGWTQTKCFLYLYVPDVDKAFDRAVKAGCTVETPLQDQFWGDRYGALVDPFGQEWSLASHVEDVPDQEIAKRAKEYFSKIRKETDSAVGKSESTSPAK